MQSSNPYLKAFATQSDNQVSIMLMNQDLEKELYFDLSNSNENEWGNAVVFSSETPMQADHKGSISPQSTRLFVFDSVGVLQEQVEYTLQMVKKNLPPQKL